MKSTGFSFGRAVRSFGAFVVFLSAAVLLSACKTPDDEIVLPAGIEELSPDSPLIGTWQDSSGSTYEISENEFSNYGESYESYAGNNLVIKMTSENSGYIYIKYTRAAYVDEDGKWNYTTDAAKAPDIGKWYAVAYRELGDSSIQISGAYKSDGKTSAESLEDAITEFTIENGYFGIFSECRKISG